MKSASVIIVILLLFSCAKRNADPFKMVVPFGPDTHSLSMSSRRGYAKARTVVFNKASDFCKSRNQIFLPKHETSDHRTCTLIFRCLNEGDPELVRPEWSSEPDITIEDKRK